MPAHLGDVPGEPLPPPRSYIIDDGQCTLHRAALMVLGFVMAFFAGAVALAVSLLLWTLYTVYPPVSW